MQHEETHCCRALLVWPGSAEPLKPFGEELQESLCQYTGQAYLHYRQGNKSESVILN